MNILKSIKFIAALAGLAVVSGCAVVPDSIDVGENTTLVAFEDVSTSIANADPSAAARSLDAGKKARWGGKIVSVVNKKDASEIEVVFFPEDRLGKPKTGMPSVGRFKAVVEGFVDPLVFEQGRLITVVGDVGDTHTGIIGEQEYTYPTLNAMGYYMWKETTDVNIEIDTFAFSPFSYGAGFHRNFFNPWYDPWMRSRHRSRIRIERYNGHSQGGTVKRNRPSTSSVSQNKPRASATFRDSVQTIKKPTQER
jgi:outer membrane lipoprotein